jgi:hypothetical protein
MNKIQSKKVYILTIADAVLYLFSVLIFLITKTELALTIWEMLTIVSGPILLFAMLHLSHELNQSVILRYAVLGFMTCVCLLTAVAHIVNISVTRRLIAEGVDVPTYFQIGQWPSVEMAVDYLAWGFFMGLAFFCLGGSIVKRERKKNRIRIASVICGSMCLVGFFGALFINDNLWYIAPMAYGPGIIVICVLALLVGTDS